MIKDIYNFLLENKLGEYTSLSQLRTALKKNFTVPEIDKANYVDFLSIFNPFDKENYIIEAEYGEHDLYDTFNLLNQIKEELLYLLDDTKSKDFDGYILTRQINPPLEAFEPVPHNKLDINPSGRDYGLLYE